MTASRKAQQPFQNRQWQVTGSGLETLPGARRPYWVDAKDLALLHLGGSLYRWPMVMGGLTWVDLDAFEDAFRAAVRHHHVPVDDLLLAQSFAAAKAQRTAPRTPRVPILPLKRFFP